MEGCQSVLVDRIHICPLLHNQSLHLLPVSTVGRRQEDYIIIELHPWRLTRNLDVVRLLVRVTLLPHLELLDPLLGGHLARS